jgi:multisubunit Na+/H+ antiporter MnhF subunit
MNVDRLSTGEKIAGGSAILLFIFMFFDWFTVSASNGFVSVSVGGSAWDALDVIPIILLIAILAAVGVAVIRLTEADFEPTISMNAVVAILAIISVLLILYRIISPPDSGFSGVSVDPAVGIFLGLIAAAGMAYGGYRAMQEEGASFGEIGDRLGSGRGGPGSGGQPPSSTPPSPPPPPPSS